MQTYKLIVLGAAITDFMAFAQHRPLQRDSVPGRLVSAPGGVGRNVAENTVRLGLHTQLITAFGDGRIGRALWESCRETGIDVSLSEIVKGQGGATHLAILDGEGELYAGIADLQVLQAIDVTYCTAHTDHFKQADAIFVETNIPTATLHWLGSQSWQARLYLDPVSEVLSAKVSEQLHFFHTLKCNQRQAEVLSGQSIADAEEAQEAGQLLLARGLQRVIITLGRNGVVAVTPEEVLYQPALPAEVVNTTGAGDAFSAGLLLADSLGLNLTEACRYGQKAAAIALGDERACSERLRSAALGSF